MVVEPDQVRVPLHVVLVGEQRGVGGQLDHVGVAFQAGHERGLGQRVPPGVALGGVLAEEDRGAVPVVGVVAVVVLQEPLRAVVVVLVDHGDAGVAVELPGGVEGGAGVVGAAVGDDGDVRVRRLDGGAELLEAGEELLGEVLLVADFQVGEVEGLGVAHLGALPAPFAGAGAVGELDEVQGVLDVPLQQRVVVDGLVLAAAGDQGGDDGQRHGADVLGEAEVLVVAEAVALVVAPEVGVGGALLDRPYGVLPLVGALALPAGVRAVVLHGAGVDQAAAGEAQKAGVQGLDLLGEVLAQAVRLVLVGVAGEEGHHVEGGARRGGDGEAAAVAGAGGGEVRGVLAPLPLGGHLAHRGERARGVLEGDGEGGAALGAGPDGEVVPRALLDADAGVVAGVGDGGTGGQGEVGAVALVEAAVVVHDLGRAVGGPGGERGVRGVVGGGVLEGPVLHQLRVQAAVGGSVDVLVEDAVHGVVDRRAPGGRVDGDRVVGGGLRVCRGRQQGGCRQEGGDAETESPAGA